MEYLLLIGVIIIVFFILFNFRSLNENEIQQLSSKRRKKTVEHYFLTNHLGAVPDLDFKKRMNPKGIFYKIKLDLAHVPNWTSALLKYKKHEWVIVAFEKRKVVDLIWVNKGIDNSSANIFIDLSEVADIALKNNYTSVLMFHNHPNPNPSRYSCQMPSNQDKVTASFWSNQLNASNINLVKYICERGRHYRYVLSPAETFYPLKNFTNEIRIINGKSKLTNFRLHMERLTN